MVMARRPANPPEGAPAFFVVRCRGERKKPRCVGDLCDGFVGRFPYPVRFVRLLRHSRKAGPTSTVTPCRACGTLHELEEVRSR